MQSANQFILERNGIQLFIKREDLLHPHVSGNKYRKLKYNLSYARELGVETLITFGGAYSNHIAATAAAGKREGFKTVGFIRGEELCHNLEKTFLENPTLAFAKDCGMAFEFIPRTAYREKESARFRESIKQQYPNSYIIPEGGTNGLAIKGCEEILDHQDQEFDYICCSAGTGGTVAGIINSLQKHQKALVFPALKGDWMGDEIKKYTTSNQFEIIKEYHFGGYAKVNETLVIFINNFKKEVGIPLDPVYTGKLLYGVLDLVDNGYFPKNSRILAIHTGGLQGIAGMNVQLARKGLPLIE